MSRSAASVGDEPAESREAARSEMDAKTRRWTLLGKSPSPQGPESFRRRESENRVCSVRAPSRCARRGPQSLCLSAPVTSAENGSIGADWSGRKDSNSRPQPRQGFGSAAANAAASSAMVSLAPYSPRSPCPSAPSGGAGRVAGGRSVPSVPAFRRRARLRPSPPPPRPAPSHPGTLGPLGRLAPRRLGMAPPKVSRTPPCPSPAR